MMLSRKGASSSTVNSVKVVRATVNVKVIKILRALRALRTVKAIWLVAGARFILTSILQAQIKSLTQVGIIILLFLAIASILTFTTIFEPIGDTGSVSEAIANNWGCFIACFSSLFMIITVDGWYELIGAVDGLYRDSDKDPLEGIIARALIAICIIFGHFMIFNLFIAINVLQVDEAQRDYHDDLLAEREALLQAKKEKILQRQNDDMKKLRDEQDARGCSFSEMVNNFKSTLKNDDYTLTENVITDIDWIENHRFCLDKLDDQTYRLQQLIFEYTNCLIYTQNEELRKRLGS